MIYREQLERLEPGFDDCPEPCKFAEDEGRMVDLPGLCGTCDVRIQFDFFKGAVERDLAARGLGGEWSFAELYREALKVAKINARVGGKGYPPDCDAVTAECLGILRREEYRPLRIARWEAEQKRGSQ